MTEKRNKCSYCEIPGHNRRTCEKLKEHEKVFSKMNSKYIKLIVDDMVDKGITKGTLVEYIQAVGGKEEVTAMGLITEFQWQELFFRKPAKRWIRIHVIGNPTIKHGSYVFSVSTPWGFRDRLWRIKFPNHELKREWCSENKAFRYIPELKQLNSAEFSSIVSSSRIGGYWRVASSLPTSSSKLLATKEDRQCLDGSNNVKEWFETVGYFGGSRECKSVKLEDWK